MLVLPNQKLQGRQAHEITSNFLLETRQLVTYGADNLPLFTQRGPWVNYRIVGTLIQEKRFYCPPRNCEILFELTHQLKTVLTFPLVLKTMKLQ